MKISCPKCKRKWHKGREIHMKINDGYSINDILNNTDIVETKLLIEELKLCPFCFIKGDFAILQESGIKIKSIVVQDEFGAFLDMDIDDFTNLNASGFNPHPDHNDDGGETMATSAWGGAGPDCIPVPG